MKNTMNTQLETRKIFRVFKYNINSLCMKYYSMQYFCLTFKVFISVDALINRDYHFRPLILTKGPESCMRPSNSIYAVP